MIFKTRAEKAPSPTLLSGWVYPEELLPRREFEKDIRFDLNTSDIEAHIRSQQR